LQHPAGLIFSTLAIRNLNWLPKPAIFAGYLFPPPAGREQITGLCPTQGKIPFTESVMNIKRSSSEFQALICSLFNSFFLFQEMKSAGAAF
jgi:hypothetical protein